MKAISDDKRIIVREIGKLYIYLQTLRFFAASGPIEILDAHFSSPTRLTSEAFTADVDFLEKQQLLQKSENGQNIICMITERGVRVLKYFNLLPATFDLDDIEDIEVEIEDLEDLEDESSESSCKEKPRKHLKI